MSLTWPIVLISGILQHCFILLHTAQLHTSFSPLGTLANRATYFGSIYIYLSNLSYTVGDSFLHKSRKAISHERHFAGSVISYSALGHKIHED